MIEVDWITEQKHRDHVKHQITTLSKIFRDLVTEKRNKNKMKQDKQYDTYYKLREGK